MKSGLILDFADGIVGFSLDEGDSYSPHYDVDNPTCGVLLLHVTVSRDVSRLFNLSYFSFDKRYIIL